MRRERKDLVAISKENLPKTGRGEDNPFYGRNHSPEAKKKVGDANRGRKASKETRAKMSAARKGKPCHTEEFKERLRERNRTRVFRHTPESRAKISKSSAWALRKGDFRYLGKAETVKGGVVGFRSLYELRALELLEELLVVQSFNYESISVPYRWDGVDRHTVPDFVAQMGDKTVVIEVKPLGYTYAKKEKAKLAAVIAYCQAHGMEFQVWTEDILWPASNPRGSWVPYLPLAYVSDLGKSLLRME